MIIARFCSDGQYYKTVYGLAQWDYGQTLQVYGLQLPDQGEVHLTEEFGSLALPVPGIRQKDGSIAIEIPDILLQSGKNIIAHIYVCDDEQGVFYGFYYLLGTGFINEYMSGTYYKIGRAHV